jgi:hypothetical protein
VAERALDSPDQQSERRVERIAVQASDEGVANLQLAARWAEQFAPEHGDTLEAMLGRFRRAFVFLDAVSHGVKPEELD